VLRDGRRAFGDHFAQFRFLDQLLRVLSADLLLYYPLLIFSVDRAKSGGIPAFSVWLGNAIMVACGCWLVRRVLRY
jgi:hypothetical protein